MTARKRLANRRHAETLEYEHGGRRCAVTASWFADGAIAEFFLSSGKAGSDVEALGRDAAIMASLAAQHGCSIETLSAAVTRDDHGDPTTPLGAALDLLASDEVA